MAKTLRKSETCLNCDTDIGSFNYCPQCGQLNTDKHVSMKYFFRDFVGEFFTFDSKFFKSFIPLVRKPGQLTNEYISGRRVRYILPLRLYIFVSFVFFFALSINSNFLKFSDDRPKLSSRPVVDLVLKEDPAQIPDTLKEKIIQKIDDSFILTKRVDDSKINVGIGKKGGCLNNYLRKKISTSFNQGEAGLHSLIKEAVNQLPKVIFLLLPVFALLLKLFYIRRKILYIQHLIFALHIHTILFMFFTLLMLLPSVYVVIPGLLGMYIYFFLAFYRVYNQSKPKTFLKLNIILLSYLPLFILGLLLLVFFTIVSL